MYRALDSEAIVATCENLRKRIAERFPGSGLSRVSVELLAVAQESAARIDRLAPQLARSHRGLSRPGGHPGSNRRPDPLDAVSYLRRGDFRAATRPGGRHQRRGFHRLGGLFPRYRGESPQAAGRLARPARNHAPPSAHLLRHLIFPLPVLRNLSLLMQLAHGRGDGPIFHLRELIQ